MDTVDGKVDLFNKLFTDYLEQHAPISKKKVTRPPAPWLKHFEICNPKQTRNEFRYNAHQTQSEDDWRKYREVRNKLKKKIRTTKCNFYKNTLNSNRPKEVWKIIHRILNPNPKNIVVDPNTLNNNFIGNVKRLTAKQDELFNMVETANYSSENNFELSCVTYEEVLKEIRSLTYDYSTGLDNISTSILKLVSDIIASPLTHIINTSIQLGNFSYQWKTAKVTPIPKVVNPEANSDYRPISILPAISKVFERITVPQICEFIEKENILKKCLDFEHLISLGQSY